MISVCNKLKYLLFTGIILVLSMLPVTAKELKFFGDIRSDETIVSVLEKINNLTDSSLTVELLPVLRGSYSPPNIYNNIDKESLTKMFNKLFVYNSEVKRMYKRGQAKMPSGNKSFLMDQFDVKARYVYINNIPFVVTMTFDFEEALYYTRPEECIELSDGTIMAYYLRGMTLVPADNYNEIYDFDTVMNLYKNKYQESDCGYHMDQREAFICSNDDIQLYITGGGPVTQQISYSQQRINGVYPPRSAGLQYDYEVYQNYLMTETINKYKDKKDSSDMI